MVNDDIYVFGGHNGITYVNDMQIFSTGMSHHIFGVHTKSFSASRQWRSVIYKGHQPSARSRHSACLIGKRIFVFGGLNDYGVHQDLNAFDTGAAALIKRSLCWRCRLVSLCCDSCYCCVSFLFYLFPLFIRVACRADGEKWVQPAIRGTAPAARAGHAAVCIGPQMVVFGGEGARDTWYNDTFALNESTLPSITLWL